MIFRKVSQASSGGWQLCGQSAALVEEAGHPPPCGTSIDRDVRGLAEERTAMGAHARIDGMRDGTGRARRPGRRDGHHGAHQPRRHLSPPDHRLTRGHADHVRDEGERLLDSLRRPLRGEPGDPLRRDQPGAVPRRLPRPKEGRPPLHEPAVRQRHQHHGPVSHEARRLGRAQGSAQPANAPSRALAQSRQGLSGQDDQARRDTLGCELGDTLPAG